MQINIPEWCACADVEVNHNHYQLLPLSLLPLYIPAALCTSVHTCIHSTSYSTCMQHTHSHNTHTHTHTHSLTHSPLHNIYLYLCRSSSIYKQNKLRITATFIKPIHFDTTISRMLKINKIMAMFPTTPLNCTKVNYVYLRDFFKAETLSEHPSF